ncbi:PHP domain-containing protein [Candidatus Woesearchaeota archaeon]|nr:PHP domain-containing protein [Candidatus Woesearchaeota archaeon]
MLKIDLHIHTIHSGHAYGTFYNVIEEAARKKMKMIAITDHGPTVLGSASRLHFGMGERAPKFHKGVKILWGCESDPVDGSGTLDTSEKNLKKLDILLVGFHEPTPYKDLGKEKNTQMLIKCFKKYKPHIFTHPSRQMYPFDLEKVCQAACDNDVLLELNLAELSYINRKPAKERERRLDMVKKTVDIARKNKKKMILNSDAHFLHEIGDDSILKKYKKRIGLTDDMIINNYPKELIKILGRKLG